MNNLQFKDLIIGAYTNYNWNQIKYWANSIDRCGFTGDKAVIVYNSDEDTVKKLSDLNFDVVVFNHDPISKNYYWPHQNLVVVVQRFYHLWQYLNRNSNYRYVITTDVKDVIFQTNPSDWLNTIEIKDDSLIASSESIKYKDEPWGNDNLLGSYPMMYEQLKDQPIFNCGVQAGTPRVLKELWLQIWFMCQLGGRYNPDQAAYNILLNTLAWNNLTYFIDGRQAWCCQAGTQADPKKLAIFGSKLLDSVPIFDGTHVMTTENRLYSIIHQYDRIPEWKIAMEKLYG